ncbi:hypothetical protein LDENG_00220320 [Lucifuga dentata]|nr:hypothetical protein LDENG_00220320 [Lucifuga dentata]
MARLDLIITTMVDIFLEYADDGGRKHQLNKDELMKVLEIEIQSPEIKAQISPNDIEEAMQMMDKNQDGEINFREFSRCVATLAKCYYNKKTGKGCKRGNKCKDGEPEENKED